MLESTSTGSDGDGRSDCNDQLPPDERRRRKRQRTLPRMMQACEHCRTRKIKCDLRRPSCANCENRSVDCHFSTERRKRGPRPGTQRNGVEKTKRPGNTVVLQAESSPSPVVYGYGSASSRATELPAPSTEVSDFPSMDNLVNYTADVPIHGSRSTFGNSGDLVPSPTDFLYHFRTEQYTPHKHGAAQSSCSPFMSIYSELEAEIEKLRLGPSMPYLARRAVDLFFECLYPIMPIVYRPRIELGLCLLQPGIERRDADIQVFSLTTALCAIASAIIPSTIFPEGSQIADKFYHASKRSLGLCCEQGLDKTTSVSIATRYFQSGYTHSVGVPRTSWDELESAIALAQDMRLHDESSYIGLDYIEEQLCRRLFWILFTGDKSAGILGKHHITLGRYLLEGEMTARYSRELEGEDKMLFVSTEPNEYELPPLITGFNFNQDLWRTAYLVLLEIDRLNERYGQTIPNEPTNRFPTPAELLRLAELHVSFETALDTIPTCLRVHPDLSFVSSQFRFGQMPNQRPLPRAVALQRINLHVSYQCLRLVIAQAMAALLDAGVPLWHSSSPLWPTFTPSDLHLKPIEMSQLNPVATHNMSEIREHGSKSPMLLLLRVRIAEDMLYMLHTSTLENLRLNGESCVEKIRLVGVSMLELVHHHSNSPLAIIANKFCDLFPHILAHMESKASDSLS